MTKASLGARVVTVVPDAHADRLVAEVRDFGLSLTREQGIVLLTAAHHYAHEFAVYQKSPRPRKVRELAERVEAHADGLAQVLSELTAEPVPHLGAMKPDDVDKANDFEPKNIAAGLIQRRLLGERDLGEMADDMRKLHAAASAALEDLPVDRGGRDDDPHLREFILSARHIYEEAGGTGKGIYRDNHVDGGFGGKLFGLVKTTLGLVLGDRFQKSSAALGKTILRALANHT
jgi:hypothetical protein